MADYGWNPTVLLKQPTINPNAALDVANSAFSNISKTLSDIKQREQEKKYKEALLEQNQKKLDFELKAPEREKQKVLEEQKRKADKAALIDTLTRNLDYLGEEQFFQDPNTQKILSSVPGWQQMSPEEQIQYRQQFTTKNGSIYATPQEYSRALRTSLAQSGMFSPEEVDTITANTINRKYPTLDKDTLKILLSETKSGGNTYVNTGGGRSSNGSYKMFPTDPNNPDKAIEDFIQRWGIDRNKGILDEYLGLDVQDPNFTAQDLDQTIARLRMKGIESTNAILGALAPYMKDGGTATIDFENLDPKQLDQIAKEAKAIETTLKDRQLYNSKTGQRYGNNTLATIQARQNYANQLLPRLAPQAASKEEILQKFVEGLGGEYKPVETQQGTVVLPTDTPKSKKEQRAPSILPNKEKIKSSNSDKVVPTISENTKKEYPISYIKTEPKMLNDTVYDIGGTNPFLDMLDGRLPPSTERKAGLDVMQRRRSNAKRIAEIMQKSIEPSLFRKIFGFTE